MLKREPKECMSQKIEKMVEKKNQIPTSFTAVTMKSQQLSIPALGPQSNVLINIQALVEKELTAEPFVTDRFGNRNCYLTVYTNS